MKDQSLEMSEDFEVFISLNLGMSNSRRKKLEIPTAPAIPCKGTNGSKHGATRSKNDNHKSRSTCTLEAEESKRLRVEGIAPRIHEDHIAGKGCNSLHHYNMVHKFIPMPQAMKIPEAKKAGDKERRKLEKISTWTLAKVRNKSDVIDEARNKDMRVHLPEVPRSSCISR